MFNLFPTPHQAGSKRYIGPLLELDRNEPRHIQVHYHCGACGYHFQQGDRLIALHKSRDLESCTVYDAHIMPAPSCLCRMTHSVQSAVCDSYAPEVKDKQVSVKFCLRRHCRRCVAEGQTTTLHEDCFKISMRHSTLHDKLHRLWVATSWISPWQGEVPEELLQLSFSLINEVDVRTGLSRAGLLCDFPQLQLLPPEIARWIWEDARDSLLWSYSTTLDLVDWLSRTAHTELLSAPLADISAWRRGEIPTIQPDNDKPIIRLTIDSRGLREIERLDLFPQEDAFRSDATAYIVESIEVVAGVEAEFQYGLGHLKLNQNAPRFRIWDTPAPPDPARGMLFPQCVYPDLQPPVTRFRTVDTRDCFGLTFLLSPATGLPRAIHANTPAQPCALTTFERLPPSAPGADVWLYVPLNDGLAVFGVHYVSQGSHAGKRLSFLLRSNLGEDVHVGRFWSGNKRDVILGTGPNLKLIYDASNEIPSYFIGAYPHATSAAEDHQQKYTSTCLPMHRSAMPAALLSTASLDSVVSIQTFHDPDGKDDHCRGMILLYENGSRRAVGQCRLGVDLARTHNNPGTFCHLRHRPKANIWTIEYKLKVEFHPDMNHEHERDEYGIVRWHCRPMKGHMDWYFTNTDAEPLTKMDVDPAERARQLQRYATVGTCF